MTLPPKSDRPYDPGADAAERYPDWVIRKRRIWPVPEVLCLRRRVILVDRDRSPATRRCALAHALAHLDLGHIPSSRPEAVMEYEADLLAARRLISWPDLRATAQWAISDEEAARELHVTMPILRMRWVHLHPSERLHLREVIADVHHA